MSAKDHLIDIEQIAEGVLLPVRVRAGGKKNAITGIHNKCLKVCVIQIPEKGKANTAIIKLLSNLLEIKRSQISLHRGSTSAQKQLLIIGITVKELQEKVSQLLSK